MIQWELSNVVAFIVVNKSYIVGKVALKHLIETCINLVKIRNINPTITLLARNQIVKKQSNTTKNISYTQCMTTVLKKIGACEYTKGKTTTSKLLDYTTPCKMCTLMYKNIIKSVYTKGRELLPFLYRL